MTTPDAWIFELDFSSTERPMTSRIRASTSAGPAVSRTTSSTPQSGLTAVSPPSVRTSMRGTFSPVVRRILHSDFALARSCRASTKIRSQVGALISDAGDAGIWRVRWLSKPSAGRTSVSTAEVRINSCATGPPKCVLHSLQAPYHGDVTSRLSSIVPVWVVAIVGAVVVGVLAAPSGIYRWLAVVLAVVVLLTFIIQLALPSKEGLVLRMAASIGGAAVLLAVATAILAVTGA